MPLVSKVRITEDKIKHTQEVSIVNYKNLYTLEVFPQHMKQYT